MYQFERLIQKLNYVRRVNPKDLSVSSYGCNLWINKEIKNKKGDAQFERLIQKLNYAGRASPKDLNISSPRCNLGNK